MKFFLKSNSNWCSISIVLKISMKTALVANSADFAVKHIRRNFFLNLKSDE